MTPVQRHYEYKIELDVTLSTGQLAFIFYMSTRHTITGLGRCGLYRETGEGTLVGPLAT